MYGEKRNNKNALILEISFCLSFCNIPKLAYHNSTVTKTYTKVKRIFAPVGITTDLKGNCK